MSMGNYMRVECLPPCVMATSETPVGIDHPTVRPENFEPDTEDDEPESGQ